MNSAFLLQSSLPSLKKPEIVIIALVYLTIVAVIATWVTARSVPYSIS